jgi:hypothetical protein
MKSYGWYVLCVFLGLTAVIEANIVKSIGTVSKAFICTWGDVFGGLIIFVVIGGLGFLMGLAINRKEKK